MKLISKICFLYLFSYHILNADSNSNLLDFARQGNLDGVKTSLSEKADINFKDSQGTSALMFAANYDHFQVVKFLVDNKADVFAKNTSGWTAAIMAGARNNSLIKEYLEAVERTIKKSQATGIVLSVFGDVSVNNRKLNVGDMILENQTVYVGKKSNCEIQIKQSQSEFTIRLREESILALRFKETPTENVFSGLVKFGSALFKVEKVFTGEKIQAITPTTTAAVRGTAFNVSVEKDGSTKVLVYDGVVKTRVRSPEIEEDEIIENTSEIKKLISNLEANSQIVPIGHSIEITPKIQKEILQKADAEGLKNRAQRKEFSSSPLPDLTLRCSEKPTIAKYENTTAFESQKKDTESLIGVEGGKLKNSWERQEIVSHIENKKEEKTISTFKPEVLKTPERILLKNGTVIKGSIYQFGRKYVIFTDEGKQVLDEEEVERFIFD